MCKKFKFDHKNKWYRHNPESIHENEMQKLLWDLGVQMDHLILDKRSDLVVIHKKKKKREPANQKVQLKNVE